MNSAHLELRSVNSLLGMHFVIPAFQRGYRWEKRQVTQLLDDIWRFRQDSDRGTAGQFYCLQPIVVRKEGESWLLIDGQQRLTTIHLVLTVLRQFLDGLGMKPFSLRYETRPRSQEFLNNIDLSEREQNIDYWHICEAYDAIKDWFARKDGSTRLGFLSTLVNSDEMGRNVKVIWYHVGTESHPADIFTRINVGKIPLTNAELIKATLLRFAMLGEDAGGRFRLRQVQIASEWDGIERSLQDPSFWHFAYEGGREYPTRIDYIFDMIYPAVADTDPYYTFHQFYRDLDSDRNVDRVWPSVKKYFETIVEWYRNTEFYHLVGFLIYAGCSVRDLIERARSLTKGEFKAFLKKRISEIIACDIDALEYGDERIKLVLLLFNIQTLLSNPKSHARFSFQRFKEEKGWDIEHVRSVKSDEPLGNARRRWLSDVLEYFTGEPCTDEFVVSLSTLKSEDATIAHEILDVLKQKKIDGHVFSQLYKKVLAHFKEDSEHDIDSISNLALLDVSTNRGYKNAPFPVKGKTILENDQHGTFVPICTKNVFLKAYSGRFADVMYWKPEDAASYLEAMRETLSEYLPRQSGENDAG